MLRALKYQVVSLRHFFPSTVTLVRSIEGPICERAGGKPILRLSTMMVTVLVWLSSFGAMSTKLDAAPKPNELAVAIREKVDDLAKPYSADQQAFLATVEGRLKSDDSLKFPNDPLVATKLVSMDREFLRSLLEFSISGKVAYTRASMISVGASESLPIRDRAYGYLLAYTISDDPNDLYECFKLAPLYSEFFARVKDPTYVLVLNQILVGCLKEQLECATKKNADVRELAHFRILGRGFGSLLAAAYYQGAPSRTTDMMLRNASVFGYGSDLSFYLPYEFYGTLKSSSPIGKEAFVSFLLDAGHDETLSTIIRNNPQDIGSLREMISNYRGATKSRLDATLKLIRAATTQPTSP